MNGMKTAAILAIAGLVAGTAPTAALAQDGGDGAWVLQLRGGAADFGTFLEERVVGGEREVTAATGFAFGGAVGYNAFDKTRLQVSGSWAPADVAYRDDTPGGGVGGGLDRSDVASMDVAVFSLEAIRYVFDDTDATFRPYTILGLSGGFWSLDADDGDGVVAAGDDSVFRMGGVGGLGVDVGLSDAFTLNLEFTNFSIGSPFDGDDAFETVGGETVDEHEKVSIREFSLGASVALGGG